MKFAFSLIELSIVLVILGLLTGGILAGKSLIRASELRSVSSDTTKYVTTLMAFRDKYFYWPGDMPNATSFWGDQATGTGSCASAATPDGTPGTCSGNGDGQVGPYSNTEVVRAWQHLAMAGMIGGDYTGVFATADQFDISSNIPAGKFPQSGFGLFTSSYLQKLVLVIGAAKASSYNANPLFAPEDSWNLDAKLDDGFPNTGRLLFNGGNAACISGAKYNLTDKDIECAHYYLVEK